MKLENYPARNYQSERLTFRPLVLDDMRVWQEFLQDPRATEYFPDFMKGINPTRALHWIEKQICRYRDKKGGLLAILEKETGNFIGQSGLIVQDVNGKEELEIGYHLLPKYWGHGYATEAAIFFKNLAFNSFKADSVISNIEVRNVASQRVAERNGLRNSEQTKWMDLDIFVYRLKKENF